MTAEDEKTYWGKISYDGENEAESKDKTTSISEGNQEEVAGTSEDYEPNNSNRRLHVQGSVIFGYGLEPQPVGRFIMAETSETEIELDDDDDEDEGDFEGGEDKPTDDFLDWSDAFQ